MMFLPSKRLLGTPAIITRVSTTRQGSARRADVVRLAGELFAEKGFRATTVREIADAAGILSGSLYHHFDSKESIGDAILSAFIEDVLADYRDAVAAGGDSPEAVLEGIIRSTSDTLSEHRAALTILQNDWSYFFAHPRFSYLHAALAEIEQIWADQLERGKSLGVFRDDLDPKLTYRLLRDMLWLPARWRITEGYAQVQVDDALVGLLFDGISRR